MKKTALKGITPGKLHREIAAVMGDKFEGLQTTQDEIIVHGTFSDVEWGMVEAMIASHEPEAVPLSLEERIAALEVENYALWAAVKALQKKIK